MSYRDTTCWELRRRQRDLHRFHQLTVQYFNNVRARGYIAPPEENESAQRARVEINSMLLRILRVVGESGVDATILWTPPPMIGGRIQSVDIIANMFNLQRFDVPPQWVCDRLQQAAGVYESDAVRAIFRTMNPLWWAKKALVSVGALPFSMLRAMGFRTERAERSFAGRLLKMLVKLIATVASFLVAVNLLGGMDWIKSLLGIDASFWSNLPE